MQEAQKGLCGVYGLWYQPWWHSVWFWALMGVVILTVIVGLVMWYRRRSIVLTPDQLALQQLHRLRSQTFISQGALHDAYFQLTMIMKQYLASTYRVDLHDKTDVQVAEELRGFLPENMLSLLQEFFDRSFHIKFAYDVVSESMLHQDIQMLQGIVVETNKLACSPEKS